MGSIFADILESLVAYRDGSYETDPERRDAQLDAIESALQAVIEKLRDLHDKR